MLRICSRVSLLIEDPLSKARETVIWEKPLASATSSIVGKARERQVGPRGPPAPFGCNWGWTLIMLASAETSFRGAPRALFGRALESDSGGELAAGPWSRRIFRKEEAPSRRC